jgi:hypothetical protein
MPDIYRDDSYSSAGSNWLGALLAPFFGIALIVLSVWQTVGTENHALRVERALVEGEKEVRSLTAQSAAQLQGKLVYFTADAKVDKIPEDPDTGVSANGLRLARQVQMYQWTEDDRTETEKRVGGGETTHHTYTYLRRWKDQWVDSSNFHHRGGHENPRFPLSSKSFSALVTAGGYNLPQSLLDKLPTSAPLALSPAMDFHGLHNMLQVPVQRVGDTIFVGASYDGPKVGDMKIDYKVAPVQPVSLVAKQEGKTFAPYMMPVGEEVYLIQPGTVSMQAMFKKAEQDNTNQLWIWRVVWWLAGSLGFLMIMAPAQQFMNIIPFVGDVFKAISIPVAGMLSLMVNGLVIIGTWIAFRPLFSLAIFGAICATVIIVLVMAKNARYDRPAY